MAVTEITVSTRGPGLYDFTRPAAEFAIDNCHGSGLLTVFVRHTSCSLTIQENADPDVLRDLQTYFTRLVPSTSDPEMAWVRHTMEGPDDMPAHIRAALTLTSLSIPISEGVLLLGNWQAIYLFEHRDIPHTRRIALHVLED